VEADPRPLDQEYVPPAGDPAAVNTSLCPLHIVKLDGEIETAGKAMTETITFC